MRHSIVFLDHDTIGPEVALRRPSIEHDWMEYDRTTANDIVPRAEVRRS
jgi:glycerate dehydrogenase